MFAEVVNDAFLLRAARRVGRYLERVVERWGQPEPYFFDHEIDDGPFAIFFEDDGDDDPDDGWINDLSAGGIQAAIDQLASAARQLETERTPETAWICIPSIPILAILQTQLTRAFELQPDAHPRLDDIFDQEVPRNVSQEEFLPVRRRYAVPDAEHWYLGDPGWLWMKVVRGWHKLVRDKVRFGGLPLKPVDIADDARIVLVGDWGSGLDRAQRVAREIRNILAEGDFEGKQQYVIHLGDVYYYGARWEYVNNFLQYWPVDPGQPHGSFIVCGNHDLYAGGRAYYRTALTDSRFARQDGKSVFALRNSHWQFLGLDTAYVERQLSNGQDGWLEDQLSSADGRRTTLLSHHPLWSDYKPEVGARLRDQIDGVLKKGGRVDAWFWGHEHRCAVFRPQWPVRFTSCVGNGGIPSFLTARMGAPYRLGVKYEYREQYGPGALPWNIFGFAVIDLDGPDMHVRYINEFGVEHHRELV
jgi:hypothetical protein